VEEEKNLRVLSPLLENYISVAPADATARALNLELALDSRIEKLGFITRPVWCRCSGGKISESFVEVSIINIRGPMGIVYQTRLNPGEIGPECIEKIYCNLLFL